MNDKIILESSLPKDIDDKIKSSGIYSTSDSVDDIKEKNAIIDTHFINGDDKRFIENLVKLCSSIIDYDKKIINIPVDGWFEKDKNLDKAANPLGCIYRYIKQNPKGFRSNFVGFTFIFYNIYGEFFPLYADDYKASEFQVFSNLLITLATSHAIPNLKKIGDKKSVKDIVPENKDSGDASEEEEIVNTVVDNIDDIASSNEEELNDMYNSDEYIASILSELEDEDDKPKINNDRLKRLSNLNSNFLEKKIAGKSVKEIITTDESNVEIPSTSLKVSSINEEWNDVKFVNFGKSYNVNDDIIKILADFSSKEYPVSIIDFKIEDTSTNQDYIDTYTVNMEDYQGKRFTLVFDIPKFKNNRFMRLRGNEKVMSGQLLLLPCIKTDADIVQCVSNYNKIFIRRAGLTGKSYPFSDKLLKALNKCKDKNLKISYGDNSAICSKYDLPIDYIDIASQINKIETDNYIYYFNQDTYYSDLGYKKKANMIPYAVNKNNGEIKCFNTKSNDIISRLISSELCLSSNELSELYRSTKAADRLNYSEASIMSNKIPLVVVMGYSIGLTGIYNLLGLKIRSTIPEGASKDSYGVIKFSDGNIYYPITYYNSMLLNGLSKCNTESYSISDIDKKSMWLDFLDDFGGRILSDGLSNFAELFMDPITREVCEHCKIPTDYFSMLIHANDLLADNEYNRHTDITGNRYRTNEIIAGYFYKAISKSYADYKGQVKRGRKVGMTMKRSAVIDGVMSDPMSSDLSILNPLLEIEAANSASFKGLSGMNSDRSYGLDKRTYDDTMINKLALSTGFAGNVGINRQTTIDMNVDTARGYIKNDKKEDDDDMSITKSFSMTEAVTPFGTTRDDPFRSAMTFIQTSKHSMRTSKSMPLLITNGADEAMPYIASDTFAFKAKENGVIKEKTSDYMIVEYDKPVETDDGTKYTKEYIDLSNNVMKNSDGGFFINMKLKSDLDVGKKFNKTDVLAYDPTSFSSSIGEDDNLSYNLGVLAKVAILNTDEGFEDSTAVSEWLSEAMATDVVVEKEVDISKNTNVYSMVTVGQAVQEGDPLIIFQNSFEEKDANMLLKNITDPEFVSDLGRIRLKSKYTGFIQDIKIYRTCDIDDDMSDSLKKIITSYEKKIKEKKNIYIKNNIPGANLLDPDYKMEATGKMKNNPNGVKIVFYISYNDKLSVGDKLVAQSANKGVVKGIFPEGKAPYSEYRPNEDIHALFAARSFNARMVTSVWSSGAINKCLIELDRQVKEIMGIEWEKIEDM